MGVSTIQSSADFPRQGGTVVVLEQDRGFRPAHLLDPELPWVVAWRWTRTPRALVAAEPALPVLTGGPGRARLRSLCTVMVMPTRSAIDIADELLGGVLAQFDREPPESLPDDLPAFPGPDLAALAATFGVRLLIRDEGAVIATAFDDASLLRLRERYLAVAGERP